MTIQKYNDNYLIEMTNIWNEAIQSGIYFPQETLLSLEEVDNYFKAQDFVGVALIEEKVVGGYVLHPNAIGRIGHVANASYAVEKSARGAIK